MKQYELTLNIYLHGDMNTRPRCEHVIINANNPTVAIELARKMVHNEHFVKIMKLKRAWGMVG